MIEERENEIENLILKSLDRLLNECNLDSLRFYSRRNETYKEITFLSDKINFEFTIKENSPGTYLVEFSNTNVAIVESEFNYFINKFDELYNMYVLKKLSELNELLQYKYTVDIPR